MGHKSSLTGEFLQMDHTFRVAKFGKDANGEREYNCMATTMNKHQEAFGEASESDDAGAPSSEWPIESLSSIKFSDGLFMFLANGLVNLPRDPSNNHQATLKAALYLAQRSPKFRDVVSAHRSGRCTRAQLFAACEQVSEAIDAEINCFIEQRDAEAKATGSSTRKRQRTSQRSISDAVQLLKKARHSQNQISHREPDDGSDVVVHV
ncbi:hypothetical protein SPRG_12872 [Saprolegnia parasitica CBS 223.65]|uniref:Uncharacterized protein n=1 Tax=Saprolegnia parasitica (strain CBS 223.65) TaxID=695850 RepID=A0A067C4B9_SAPPC|nr:hypothetical protein SPRG_12872 [Saprolegnia parasitica CBS 223.65]KDO21632.1 hypothetical protein SPRG_12872 [Saprolegnia parasitica CBS 223.65]|eukprot:XP_012207644.1 hypothetical protein SPRG_12872 [Saprolegnia parasitica CBS 223.65]